jgi:hypothetical protein
MASSSGGELVRERLEILGRPLHTVRAARTPSRWRSHHGRASALRAITAKRSGADLVSRALRDSGAAGTALTSPTRPRPSLQLGWDKRASTVVRSGRLVPWSRQHSPKNCNECKAQTQRDELRRAA